MKIAFLGDAHWGARNNSDFFQRKQIDFYENQFFPYLVKNKIDTVIQFGDLLDQRKFINVRTMASVREHYLAKFDKYGIDHMVILGNHDIVHKNTSRLSALREIIGSGIEFQNTTLIDIPSKRKYGDCSIDFLPWINEENYEESMEFIKQSSSNILIGHLEINSFEMMPGYTCSHGVSTGIFKDYHMVYSGHFHKQAKRGNIHYIGTPYEMDWGDFGQRKGFHIFDTASMTTEFIPNTNPIYHKLIYDDTSVDYDNMNMVPYTETILKVVVENKENDMMFERFVDNVQKYCHELVISDKDTFELGDEDIDSFDVEDSLSVLLGSVDSINTRLNKDSIKNKIGRIHSAAQNILEEV